MKIYKNKPSAFQSKDIFLFVLYTLALFSVFICDSAFADIILDQTGASKVLGKTGTSANALSGGEGINITTHTTPTGYVLCRIVLWINGSTGKGFAVLGVIAIAIELLFVKASWTRAVLLGVGISVWFGATWLVPSISEYASGCDFS